jgi:hypothetical protein
MHVILTVYVRIVGSLHSTHLMGIDPKPNNITRPAKILVDGVCVKVFGWFRPLMVIVLLCDCYVMHVSCYFCCLFLHVQRGLRPLWIWCK